MRNRIVNLMVKDFRVLLSEKMMAITSIVMFVFCALFGSSLTIAGLLITFYMISMCTLYTFALEEKYHSERFFASLAVKRRDVVTARYMNGLAVTAAYLAIAFLLNAIFLLAGVPIARPITLGYVTLLLAVVAVSSAISMPLYFKFGYARARVLTILVYIVPMAGGGLLTGFSAGTGIMPSLSGSMTAPSALFSLDPFPSLLIAAAALMIWGASVPVAVHLYKGRDL
jgi:hypothetical protein